MNIYPFCYVCPRDWKMFELLHMSWMKIGRRENWTVFHDRKEPLTSAQKNFCDLRDVRVRQRADDFHPWCGWKHAMSKFYGWMDMVSDPDVGDDDYVLYCDSDTVFWNDEILKQFEGYDFIGFPHSVLTEVKSLGRKWSWMSGCFQAARAGKVRRMVNMTTDQLEAARKEMLDYSFSHNEDVVISFLMAKVAAEENRLDGSDFYETDPQAAFKGEIKPKSFTHLSGNPTTWLGVPVTGKWDIPMAVEKAGVWK